MVNSARRVDLFFSEYHKHLREAGVDGVKVKWNMYGAYCTLVFKLAQHAIMLMYSGGRSEHRSVVAGLERRRLAIGVGLSQRLASELALIVCVTVIVYL